MTTASGPYCPVMSAGVSEIQLGHGSGGRLSGALFRECFLPNLSNSILDQQGDAAILPALNGDLAISTDTFVVSPLEFPGGDIGQLAVHGTLNDIAMMAARPVALTAGFVIEEGLPMTTLQRLVASMARAANDAGVPVVAGDTKVVERGKADGLYINTTGLGVRRGGCRPTPDQAIPGDRIVLSAPLGLHGMAIMAAREGLGLETEIVSDTANLYPLVERLVDAIGASLHVLRDPTRGGLASATNEIAMTSRIGIVLDEATLPIPPAVMAACEILGLDPLYVANEGVLVAFVAPECADLAVTTLRSHPLGREARVVGEVTAAHHGVVLLRTPYGSSRVVDLLPGDQLPRIC